MLPFVATGANFRSFFSSDSLTAHAWIMDYCNRTLIVHLCLLPLLLILHLLCGVRTLHIRVSIAYIFAIICIVISLIFSFVKNILKSSCRYSVLILTIFICRCSLCADTQFVKVVVWTPTITQMTRQNWKIEDNSLHKSCQSNKKSNCIIMVARDAIKQIYILYCFPCRHFFLLNLKWLASYWSADPFRY